jgi:hypothetical protein
MEENVMAYRFAEKRQTVQEEMAYIVYMIVGSYFIVNDINNFTLNL